MPDFTSENIRFEANLGREDESDDLITPENFHLKSTEALLSCGSKRFSVQQYIERLEFLYEELGKELTHRASPEAMQFAENLLAGCSENENMNYELGTHVARYLLSKELVRRVSFAIQNDIEQF